MIIFLFHPVAMQAGRPKVSEVGQKIGSGCLPATGWAELDIANVRARIQVGGDMWWDLQGNQIYEVPKGSGKFSVWNGAIWIGGLDPNGQLRLAAQVYRIRGNDFWPGPLSIHGSATADPAGCEAWDRMWVITREQVREFISHYDEAAGRFIPTAGYPEPPEIIREWPWRGDMRRGHSPYLAPFSCHRARAIRG
ncbi:MAG: hypothetical protein R6V49_02105 [Bacteroidales bacterium]